MLDGWMRAGVNKDGCARSLPRSQSQARLRRSWLSREGINRKPERGAESAGARGEPAPPPPERELLHAEVAINNINVICNK
jgi:hypothetical protein